jgi:hypothetical protein
LFNAPFHTAPSPTLAPVPIPCPSDGTKYPQPGSITVAVLNGSGQKGEAQATADGLKQSGFKTSYGNGKRYEGVVMIVAGTAGVDNAYTVYQFAPKGSVLTLDGRTDATVDFVLGEQYERLPPSEEVAYDATLVIEPLPKCQPAEEIAATLPPPTPSASPAPAALGATRD